MHHACGIAFKFREIFRLCENLRESISFRETKFREISRKLVIFS
jgi:hypothetical protein